MNFVFLINSKKYSEFWFQEQFPEAHLDHYQTFKIEYFATVVGYFGKMLHLRCLTGLWMHVWFLPSKRQKMNVLPSFINIVLFGDKFCRSVRRGNCYEWTTFNFKNSPIQKRSSGELYLPLNIGDPCLFGLRCFGNSPHRQCGNGKETCNINFWLLTLF